MSKEAKYLNLKSKHCLREGKIPKKMKVKRDGLYKWIRGKLKGNLHSKTEFITLTLYN